MAHDGIAGMTPTRVRHGVVMMALALAILAYVQRVAISQAAGPISADLGLDKSEMGMVFGAFGLSYALFEIPMGLIGDKLGVKKILSRLVLAWSFFTALTGAAWSFSSMLAIRFLFGAGEAGCFPNLTRMLSQWLPRGERVKAQALMWACARWGGAVTPPLVLLAINFVGWRWAFVLFGLLGAAWVAWFSRRFHERPADHPGVNDAEQALLAESQALVAHAPESWVKLLLRPQALLLCLQYFCWSYVWYFFVTWMPTFLGEAHGRLVGTAAADGRSGFAHRRDAAAMGVAPGCCHRLLHQRRHPDGVGAAGHQRLGGDRAARQRRLPWRHVGADQLEPVRGIGPGLYRHHGRSDEHVRQLLRLPGASGGRDAAGSQRQ
jgi:MFS family permease